jgi:hypothetical protein
MWEAFAMRLLLFAIRLLLFAMRLLLFASVGCGVAGGPTLADALGLAVPHTTSIDPHACADRRELGAAWVRRDIAWEDVEIPWGTFDFSAHDDAIAAERAAGMHVLAILDYGHRDASQLRDAMAPPDDLAAYERYVRTVVTHFRGRIDAYEIWNEPNFAWFWRPQPDPERYAQMVALAARVVHESDADAEVVLGGMLGNVDALTYGGGPWGFLERLPRATLDAVDAVAIHPYTWFQGLPPETRSGSVDRAQFSLLDMLREARRIGTGTPLWVTEQGWHTWPDDPMFPGVTEEEQAAYLVRATVLALAESVARVFHYTYVDSAEAGKEGRFGMVRQDGTAKPAYGAFRTLARELSAATFSRDLSDGLGAGEFAYAFTRADETLVVYWSTHAESAALPFSVRDVVDLYGEPTSDTSLATAPRYGIYQ